MKTNFDSKLFEKQINTKSQSMIYGCDTSGGTETGSTHLIQEGDTYETIYTDNCDIWDHVVCPNK
jgi:hypothetical protein